MIPNDTDLIRNIILIEAVSLTVLFILGRLVQLLLNREKKPYISRDVNDSRLMQAALFLCAIGTKLVQKTKSAGTNRRTPFLCWTMR